LNPISSIAFKVKSLTPNVARDAKEVSTFTGAAIVLTFNSEPGAVVTIKSDFLSFSDFSFSDSLFFFFIFDFFGFFISFYFWSPHFLLLYLHYCSVFF
uniref:Uncharacterized protein n=1 Tax=Ciona intestinalis TaxID=7719 RepID=F6QEM6_CIOIN